jgi:hypothetical protein
MVPKKNNIDFYTTDDKQVNNNLILINSFIRTLRDMDQNFESEFNISSERMEKIS